MRPMLALAILLATATAGNAQEWVTKASDADVAATANRLEAAIETAGATLFARVDHAAGAKAVDSTLDPTTLVIFGNPQIGTPIIAADRRAGLDLPIRVLIWEENGETTIGYEEPEALKARYDIEGADEAFEAMTGALDRLTDAASGR